MPKTAFENEEMLEDFDPKKGLKNVSTQKSIFEHLPKKTTQDDLEKRVKEMHKQSMLYKQKMSELAVSFRNILDDKRVPSNKNPFVLEKEKEILGELLNLASEINNDEDESAGMGSLSLITILLKTSLKQRDKINQLEYSLYQLIKKISEKENNLEPLDNKIKSE